MLTTNDEPSNQSNPKFLTKLLWILVPQIVVVIIGLIFEYKSGIFQKTDQSIKNLAYYYFSISFIIVMIITTILFFKDSFMVWLRQQKHLREELSLLLFSTFIFATLLLIASILTGLMPWSIPFAFYQVFITKNVVQLDNRWTDYALMITFYFIFIMTLHQLHKKWHGLKSVEQYRHEQRSEILNYFTEGIYELRRLLKHEKPLQIYTDINPKQFILQLEPVSDTLVWKDQAKELIRLSSSSYAFDIDSCWHDRENCWVGRNVNTGELVFLLPHQGEISESDLKELLMYLERVASNENKSIGEIIVATKTYIDKPIQVKYSL